MRRACLAAMLVLLSACGGSAPPVGGRVVATIGPANPPLTPLAASPTTSARETTAAQGATQAERATPAAPSPTRPRPGTIMYQADWSGGMAGWFGSPDWKVVNGTLVNDGTKNFFNELEASILAPVQLSTMADYAVEADIQLITFRDMGIWAPTFGLAARFGEKRGYLAGWQNFRRLSNALLIWPNILESFWLPLAETSFDPGTRRHVYRLEVKGNIVRLLVDGTTTAEVIDNRYLDAGRIGLWSSGAQIIVHSFKVIAL